MLKHYASSSGQMSFSGLETTPPHPTPRCGTRAQLPCSMWDLSSPTRIEPASPAFRGRFLTTGPPGQSSPLNFLGFPGGSVGKNSPATQENTCNTKDVSSIPGSERSPGEENGYPLQILAWRIPWTEEPGGLQSMGLQESDRTEQLNHHPSPRARFSSLPQ